MSAHTTLSAGGLVIIQNNCHERHLIRSRKQNACSACCVDPTYYWLEDFHWEENSWQQGRQTSASPSRAFFQRSFSLSNSLQCTVRYLGSYLPTKHLTLRAIGLRPTVYLMRKPLSKTIRSFRDREIRLRIDGSLEEFETSYKNSCPS